MDSEPIPVCFAQLEQDLFAALETDDRNQLENDAKLRAVSQRVSYEEFKELVRGCHLKPANCGSSVQKTSRGRIWNNIAINKRNCDTADNTECHSRRTAAAITSSSNQYSSNQIPHSSSQFLSSWQQSDVPARLMTLYKLGPVGLGKIFSIDMPTALLGEIFEALLSFNPTIDNIVTVVTLLDALTRVRRFSLVIHFLNAGEKAVCQQLIHKLLASLTNREQDLAELCITEWTIQEIGKKFLIKV